MGAAGAGRGGEGRRLRARHAAAVAAGLVVGASLVLLVFFEPEWAGGRLVLRPRFDLGAFARGLPAHAHWLVPYALLAGSLPALRSLVWRSTLSRPVPPFRDTYHSTAIGALVHNTVPGKLGPVAASWVLARHARRPFAPTLSAELVAKLLEMGMVVLLGALAATVAHPAAGLRGVVLAGAAVFATLASAAAALAVGSPRAAARLRGRFPRAGAVLAALGEGLVGTGSARRLAQALLLAALPALVAALAYGLPLAALDVERSAAGGALLVAVITFGQLTPGLPIGTGVYWSLAAWAARELGAAPADAAAVAVLTHAGTVSANLAVGATSALVRRADLAELFRRRREVARLAEVGGPAEPSPRAPT